MRKIASADWVQADFAKKSMKTEFILHADTIAIDMNHAFSERVRFRGWLRERSPAWWADKFVEQLEPCWQPATATPPWKN